MALRGAVETEVVLTVEKGQRFQAKYGRSGFRMVFPFDRQWRGMYYQNKEVEAYAVRQGDDWLVLTAITRYS